MNTNIEELLTNDNFIYFLGYLWADGYVQSSKRTILLSIVKNDAENIKPNFDKINEFLLRPFTYHAYPAKKETWAPISRFYSSDPVLHEFLLENDYRIKSKTPPYKVLKQIPKEKHNLFYLGFFDGDGCFSIGGNSLYQLSFSGPIETNWAFLVDLLNSLNVTNKTVRYKRNKNSSSSVVSYGMYNLEKLGDFFYSNCENIHFLQRKYEKYIFVKNRAQLPSCKCKGVFFQKSTNRFIAYIAKDRKKVILGSFLTEDEAVQTRLIADRLMKILV